MRVKIVFHQTIGDVKEDRTIEIEGDFEDIKQFNDHVKKGSIDLSVFNTK